MIYSQVQKYIQELLQCQSIAELDRYYTSTLLHLECDRFAHSYYDKDHFAKKYPHDVSTPSLAPWHQHFIKEEYEHVDHIGKSVRSSIIPIQWDIEKEYQQSEGKLQRMFGEALDFNLSTGVSIPFHDANNEVSILSVHLKNLSRHLEKHPHLLPFLQQLGLYYHHRLSRLLHADDTIYSLTAREKECLALSAQHKTAKEIARALHITPRTVSFHIENVLKKLNVRNKYEAISLLNL